MAEVVLLSPLLRVIFEKLASPLLAELKFGRDFKEIKKLERTLQIIQAVIEDAEEQQLKFKKVKIWLTKLKDVAYDADDLFDKITTTIVRRNLKKKKKNKKVWVSCFLLEPYANYFKLSGKLKQIRKRLEDIAREMSNFQLREGVACVKSEIGERQQTGPYVDESEICGREDDAERLVEMLLSPNTSNSMDVPIIPVVGMGGIGKTTLAQLVYNDRRVTRNFDKRIWISTSDKFNMRKLISEILDYVTEHKCESAQMGVLQSQLRESLCGKRYLLVLDDVWDDDQDEWDKLRNPLKGGTEGSKILVTTRNVKVASMMTTTAPYVVGVLGEDECWTLFKHRAFAEGEAESHPNLLPIGRKIVEKCKGLPLAAKILGGLLRLKREESEWSYVQGSGLWNLYEGESRILSVLWLSYNHLPSHLKRCFAYCSLFPKNYEINKEELIHLWIAEGLIQLSCDGHSLTMEDTGNEYFNELLWMSFFQRVSQSDDSSVTKFKMHDLIRDLAQYVAGNEFLTLEHDSISQSNGTQSYESLEVHSNLAQTRHALVVSNFNSSLVPEALYEAKKLRTLNLLSTSYASGENLPKRISAFKRLRVLNLSGCRIERLHKSLGRFIHLRYLDLSNNLFKTLPATICHLYNLQTLNLSGCNYLMELPSTIINLINLRHLYIQDCARLSGLPASIGKLRKLQTLPIFVVGHTYGESLIQLMHLDLRGELTIRHLEKVADEGQGWDAELLYKKLHSLRLAWGDDDNEGKMDHHLPARNTAVGRSHNTNVEILLENLCPNPSLRRLAVKEYPGSTFPQWMDAVTLPNLTELMLINCSKCRRLPALGQIPNLKVLYMQQMDAVVNIGCEFYGKGKERPFPKLNKLTFKNFPHLRTWESTYSTDSFMGLNKLTIIKCPILTTMPRFPSLQNLELQSCDVMILRSAAGLNSLSTLVIDVFPELLHLPQGLLQNNPCLMSLTISSCPQLSSLPWDLRNLKNLKSLTIGWCEELNTLPQGMRNFTCLETLEIIECPGLISLPEEAMSGLVSLQSFSIENCRNLTSLPMGMKYLTALEHLMIMYCPNLECLPNCLQYLSALRSLNILSCPEIASLPDGLQHVSTLQNLEIRSCPKLVELPEWIENLASLRSLAITDCQNVKSLPEGLQHLSALQHLSIGGCPDLEERCQKGGGKDWSKISHIPHTYIGSSLQQRRNIAINSPSYNP